MSFIERFIVHSVPNTESPLSEFPLYTSSPLPSTGLDPEKAEAAALPHETTKDLGATLMSE